MATVVQNAPNNAVTLTFSTSIDTLATGAYSVPSDTVNNVSGSATTSYLTVAVRLAFSAALTAGAGTPYITLYMLEARDGTNLPNPPGTAAAAPAPGARQVTMPLVASGAFSIVDFPEMEVGSYDVAFQFLNESGVDFSGTVTATAYFGSPEV